MLRRDILDYLEGRLEADAEPIQGFRREQVAAAALLVQCARVDAAFGDDERAVICSAVREHLGLDAETCEALVEVAEQRTEEVWDDWLFLDAVRRGFGPEERVGILECLWEVAHADGRMHPLEEHLISRIGSELGISEADRDRLRAQAWKRIHEAQDEQGG
jgi:uncharacterized tellurite resistance protein B-like protein